MPANLQPTQTNVQSPKYKYHLHYHSYILTVKGFHIGLVSLKKYLHYGLLVDQSSKLLLALASTDILGS
jgi:hypothetical protein